MAKKNNIRSMRFSDTVIDMIERQQGRNFTEKFDNLVTRCMWELPRKEEELADLQRRIERERERLKAIRKKIQELDELLYT